MNLIPMLSKWGKNRSGFEATKATENLKYFTQIFRGGEEKMAGFGLGKSWQPYMDCFMLKVHTSVIKSYRCSQI
jgi:hypothetical protein